MIRSSLRYQLHDIYSVCPRPDGSVVLGASRGWSVHSLDRLFANFSPRKGIPPEVYEAIVNTVDDSGPSDILTENGLRTFAKLMPKGGWSADGFKDGNARGYEYAWSGIIGMVRR